MQGEETSNAARALVKMCSLAAASAMTHEGGAEDSAVDDAAALPAEDTAEELAEAPSSVAGPRKAETLEAIVRGMSEARLHLCMHSRASTAAHTCRRLRRLSPPGAKRPVSFLYPTRHAPPTQWAVFSIACASAGSRQQTPPHVHGITCMHP